MEEKHPYCLMEAADKSADVERICGDETNQATTMTAGVSTEGGVFGVISQDTSSLFTISIKMYLLNETINKSFTKNAIIAILVGVFKHTPKKNYKRGALLETLNTLVKESPWQLLLPLLFIQLQYGIYFHNHLQKLLLSLLLLQLQCRIHFQTLLKLPDMILVIHIGYT